jgi:hypothetical protein
MTKIAAMYLNHKLSTVRFVTADMKSTDISALVASLPIESEARQAIELLKEIRNVGDVGAVEILFQTA